MGAEEGCRPSRACAESGKQLKAKGGWWWGQTHLHGPHQSVCWLRPKRARHFLGEPGSAHGHAREAEQAEGEQAGSRAGQGPEGRGNVSVSQSQILHSPRRQRASPQPAPVGTLGPRAKVPGKAGIELGIEAGGRRAGMRREGPYRAGSSLQGSCRRAPGGLWGSSLFCLRAAYPLPNSLPFYPGFVLFCIFASAQSV